MVGVRSRARAVVGLAWSDLAHARLRTALAICGVAIAVLTLVLLAGAGAGVLETGDEQFEQADRDLWLTGDAIGLTPAGGGGFEATIQDAHPLAADIEAREDVDTAAPMAFQTLYVGTDPDELETIVVTGVPGGGSAVSIQAGDGFSGGDTHYADGSYDGPPTEEVLVDEATADHFGLAVGDEIHLGGSVVTARETRYEVVGISDTFAGFLGTETATIRLSELQTLSNTAETDAATMIAITVDGDAEAVADELRAEYPAYTIRSNEEQLRAVLGQQAAILTGAALLVGFAVLTGAALTVTLLSLHVYQRRQTFGTLRAIGVSKRTIGLLVLTQGLILGAAGWILGAALSMPLARALNAVVGAIVGYEGLVAVPPEAIWVSGVVAIGLGALAAATAAWRLPEPTQ